MTTQLDLLDREWCYRMAPIVLDRMRGREFCADDIHDIVEPPANPNLFGVLFAQLKPHLERVGWVTSKRPSRNCAVLRSWRVK